jgi:hypothetical protein
MTMLLHTRGRLEGAPYSPRKRNTAGAGAAPGRLAKIKRFCISALTVVAAGVVLTAIMALKVIAYLPHSHY